MTEVNDIQAAEEEEQNADGGGRQNIRSTIAFPYSPLADAEQVADALRRRGDTAAMDQIAAEMEQQATSGAFRTKIATARTFGAIESRRGQVHLTPLGHRLVDPAQVERARVDAFLHVPLFKRVYEEYRGRNLPPAKGLEATMERMGVSSKQLTRARQSLQRSAEQAGFFRNGSDRLVLPVVSGGAAQTSDMDTPLVLNVGDTDSGMPTWFAQMWLTLVNDGESWPAEQIKAYVDGARTAYKATPK
jgi:hypothetical protein